MKYQNVVESIEDIPFGGPVDLRIFSGVPCEVDPQTTICDSHSAIIEHCKCSSEQLRKYSL